MQAKTLAKLVIEPVLNALAFPQQRERSVLLLAIAIQESGLTHRRQIGGPARSWWQIEPPTCADCLDRCPPVLGFARELGLYPNIENALELSDLFACAVAAGILRLTPGRLPDVGDEAGAWKYYIKAWRPGKPRPERWAEAYREAVDVA